ncbi:hypothetical protein [Pseudoxanthomonas kalamensis]|uniref:hypothetical protein n=1 Tax=Pseudoxanthomonas kalamensis TaxID=289483 RepID=UPI001391A98E|nr:hypothetical protein [Pseudoxanthomonas kalamensis]
MNFRYALLAGLLVSVPAAAQQPAPPETPVATDKLDLSLPEPTTTYGNDPPGTWYGDTSGEPAAGESAMPSQSLCPTSPDGEENAVTGSVAAGIGHSAFGTSTYTAARLNYCKEYASDEGKPRSVNVSISVGQSNGADGWRAAPPPGRRRRP